MKDLFIKKSIVHIADELSAHEASLKRTLTVKDLVLFGIAAIVGAGIFSTIGQAVVNGGPAVSLLFVFTALSCGLSALCYAQFASAVPLAGSAYTYAYVSFGELTAWIVGWDLFMEYAISNIAVAISWSDYFVSLMAGFGINILKNYEIFGHNVRLDFPALGINALLTALCYIGIKESKSANNVLVFLKIGVILAVLTVGAFYVQPNHWMPFAPNGVSGVLYGVSSIVFAYIGFDAISTTSEECKNPQKDMPKAMLWALGLCTLLYVLVTLVLTGMVPYYELGVGDPLAFVFEKVGLTQFSGFIALFSVITLSSAMLVYQLGMPRIWMSMSRDGLLPKAFSKVHTKFKTPSFATVIMGLSVGIPALFADLKGVVDLTSIGTLFAFALVCGGLWWLELTGNPLQSKFKVPYINSAYVLPFTVAVFFYYQFTAADVWQWRIEKFPIYVFYFLSIIISAISAAKRLSLIPSIGLLSNLYLMAELGAVNWLRFLVWLLLGVAVYVFYGYKNSKLRSNITK